jgi:hypothetical protein
MFLKDPWPWQLLMQLALVITIPTLFIAVFLGVVYERDICITMLDWLREVESKRFKVSPPAFGRMMHGHQKAVKSR